MSPPDPGRLASSLGELKPHYDVVVVGSGYGGAVAAARLAKTGKRVCVLERGRERRPGDYPDTLARALREFQVDLPGRHMFSPNGLFDLRVNHDMHVLVGCGLGGTSLINANVAFQPDEKFFDSDKWPEAIRRDARAGRLTQWFRRAAETLEIEEPSRVERPRKLRVLDEIAERAGEKCELAPVAVTFPGEDGEAVRRNRAGMLRHSCTGCGDCVSGCNYGAKNTLIMNYLPEARQNRAEIFAEIKVAFVEPMGRPGGAGRPRWRVHVELVGAGREGFGAPLLSITADTVVLAAGVLGSTEILFRSIERGGLRLSRLLGKRFSGNGDVLAFSYNNRNPVNAVGLGARAAHGQETPGPCISGYIRRGGMLLEDGVIPGALASILSAGFVVARLLTSRDEQPARPARGDSIWRALDRCVRGGVSATQTFLAMVEDPEYGELVPDDGRVRVRWPDAGRAPAYAELERWLVEASGRLGGAYVPSPFGKITVHPLGGCVMGDDVSKGVVDDSGAVFNADGGRHDGLYVCDGSIVPCALGVNPLLTITALAERAAASIRTKV